MPDCKEVYRYRYTHTVEFTAERPLTQGEMESAGFDMVVMEVADTWEDKHLSFAKDMTFVKSEGKAERWYGADDDDPNEGQVMP